MLVQLDWSVRSLQMFRWKVHESGVRIVSVASSAGKPIEAQTRGFSEKDDCRNGVLLGMEPCEDFWLESAQGKTQHRTPADTSRSYRVTADPGLLKFTRPSLIRVALEGKAC